jgi:hypothetical protein
MNKIHRAKPEFFERIHAQAKKDWDLREKYTGWGRETKLLFEQIQKPHHVISELLQNADDADATEVIIQLKNDFFVFEHNGRDFSKNEFAALCDFAKSSKKKLYTIGFRGIGFKSTFSIGDSVEVLTPSIAVRFERNRFTLPYWIDDANPTENTLICVKIQDSARKERLKTNLNQWSDHPISLLFFKKIERLMIKTDFGLNRFIRKTQIGNGPTPDSFRFALDPCDDHGNPLNESERKEYLLIRLTGNEFPDFAKEEIKNERFSDDSEIPSFNIDLILGLPDEQKIYVVLPTEVNLWLPYSINAPFIPGPDRVSIKDISISKTNEWILEKAGEFAGKCMMSWLNDETLFMKERAAAYKLLPNNEGKKVTLGEQISSIVCNKIYKEIEAQPVLLSFDGALLKKDQCVAPPKELYSVWDEETLNQIFGSENQKLLSKEVSKASRDKLESWQWLKTLGKDGAIQKMIYAPKLPKPVSSESMQTLWEFANKSIPSYDEIWKSVKIVPVEGKNKLYASKDVIRLSEKSVLAPDTIEFVKQYTNVFDQQFIQWIKNSEKDDAENKSNKSVQLFETLKKLGLDQASPSDRLIKNLNLTLSKNDLVQKSDYIRLAQMAAVLDAKVDKEFQYFTKCNNLAAVDTGIIFNAESNFEKLIPDSFTGRHLLDSLYFAEFIVCNEDQWSNWSTSEKCGLLPFAPFEKKKIKCNSLDAVNKLAVKRNFEALSKEDLHYAYDKHFELSDYDFPDELIVFWENNPELWAAILVQILQSPSWYWEKKEYAALKQFSNNGNEREIKRNNPILANWIMRFRSIRCLIDTNGEPDYPSSLFMHTPETEPLINTPDFNFVDATLVNERTKPLLKTLGVMSSLTNISPLIDSLQQLSTRKEPLKILHEIVPVYKAIDNIWKKRPIDDQESAFKEFYTKRLVLSQEGNWVKADGEVFLSNEDGDFEVATIHDSIRNLSLWKLLKIEKKPSNDTIIKWMKKLKTGEKIDGQSIKQIKAALKRYPVTIWEECRHWLTLHEHWMPIDKIKYHLKNNENVKQEKLYDSIRSISADFLMLPTETCDTPPFNVLKDLSQLISYKPKFADKGIAETKEWIKALGNGLKRIKREDADETSRIRANAERLFNTTWQSVKSIESQPYIGDEIVGESIKLKVLWNNDSLFVTENWRKFVKDITKALFKPFEDKDITEAIEYCFNRDEKEIIDYLEANFDLEPEECIENKEKGDDGKKEKGSGEKKENPQDGKPNTDGGTHKKTPATGQKLKKELNLKDIENNPYIVGEKKEMGGSPSLGGGGGGDWSQTEPPSPEDKKRIEERSRQLAIKHLRKLGYENIKEMGFYHEGYDIEAEKDGNRILVEVKGHAGSALKADVSISQIREYDRHLGSKNVRWELWNIENLSEEALSPMTITPIGHIPDEAMEAKSFRVDLTKCSIRISKEDEAS